MTWTVIEDRTGEQRRKRTDTDGGAGSDGGRFVRTGGSKKKDERRREEGLAREREKRNLEEEKICYSVGEPRRSNLEELIVLMQIVHSAK